MQQLLPIWMQPKHLTDGGCLCNVGEVAVEGEVVGFAAPSPLFVPLMQRVASSGCKTVGATPGGFLNSLCKQPLGRCQISGVRGQTANAVFNDYFYRYRRHSFSKVKCTNDCCWSTNDVTSEKCREQAHTRGAVVVGSSHRGISHYAHSAETTWTICTKRSTSRFSHKTIDVLNRVITAHPC